MLELSSPTYGKMLATEEQRFVAKLGKFLRSAVPELAAEPEPEMSVTIRALKEQARGYAMLSERAVAAYALTAAHLGVDFAERFRGIRQILLMDRPQEERAKLLGAFTDDLLQTLARR